MKRTSWVTKLFIAVTAFFFMASLQAGKPLWSFTPLTTTTIVIPAGGTAVVQYTITNQSSKTHTLQMTLIPGVSQIITPGNCSNRFTLGPNKSCTLSLQIIGNSMQGNIVDGPQVCDLGNAQQCYKPTANNLLNVTQGSAGPTNPANLSASVGTLMLKTSGIARIITITNNGPSSAENVTYSPSPALPAGSFIAPASCGTIAPGGFCVLTITPGATPSQTPGDIDPTPIVLTINGTNTNTLTPTLNIVTYGNVYQAGYFFSFDDSTPITGSVGGKVISLVDQVSPLVGVIWSSNGISGTTPDVAEDNIPGIYETSTNPPDACNGATDGVCNTNVVVAYYSPPTTNPAVNLSFYAAGVCRGATTGGFNDWYLLSSVKRVMTPAVLEVVAVHKARL